MDRYQQPAQFVNRHLVIMPVTGAPTSTSKVTLYFTQAEFEEFNALHGLQLPACSNDVTGKAGLYIEQLPGTSGNGTALPAPYTGTPVTINPAAADIVFNKEANCWVVSFDVTGFSGFFVKTSAQVPPLAKFYRQHQPAMAECS